MSIRKPKWLACLVGIHLHGMKQQIGMILAIYWIALLKRWFEYERLIH